MTRQEKIIAALVCTWAVNIVLACYRPKLERDLPPYGVTIVVSGDAGGCWSPEGGIFRKGPCP